MMRSMINIIIGEDNMGKNFVVKLNEYQKDSCPYSGCSYNNKGNCKSANVNKQIKEGEIISDFQCPSVSVPEHICEFCGRLLMVKKGKMVCTNGCLDGQV